MKLIISLLAATLLLSSCGGGGGGDDSDSDLSQNACGTLGLNSKIIEGTQCSGLDASPVVRIQSNFANGIAEACSGTMITPNVVLTAVHCFIDFTDPDNSLIGSDVIYGDAPNFKFATVREILVSSLLRVEQVGDEAQLFNDFAILRLSSSLPLPTLPILSSRSPGVGEVADIFGYGRTNTGGPDTPSDNLGLFSGQTEVTTVTNNHIRTQFLSGGSGTCFGDSGGPLVINIDGQPTIAGVLSQFVDVGDRQPDCSRGAISQYTNLQSSELLSDILDTVPQAATK